MSLRASPINNEFGQNKCQVFKRVVNAAKAVAPAIIPAAIIIGSAIAGAELNLWWMYNHDMPLEIAKCGAHPEASWFVSHLWVKQLEYGGGGAVVGGFVGATAFAYAADTISDIGGLIRSRLEDRKELRAVRKNSRKKDKGNDGPKFG